jgi:hypothetical protein
MVRKTSLLALVVGLLVASSFVGAAAFTSATVDRDATISVAADDNGIIGLSPGSSSMVSLTEGELTIDATTTDSDGINTDASVEVGDPANPSSTYAFALTNNAGSAKDLSLSYTLDDSSTDTDGSDNLQFAVYDSTGSEVSGSGGYTFAEGGSYEITDASSAETYYVVLTIDTGQGTNGDDLSGTLTVSAE